MKKKLLTAFLVTALGISMLSGCGGKNSDDNSTKSEQSTKEKDQEAADKVAKLIDDIYVQERTDKTDEQCEAAKKAWDALTDAQKELVEGENADPDYFGRDTGDASKDDPLNEDEIGENELLVVSFGTSFNDSRANVVWQGFTTKWYTKLFQDTELWMVFGKTLFIAVVTTLLGVVVGTMGAVGFMNAKFKGKKLITNSIYFPIVIPEIVLAIATLLVFTQGGIDLSMGTIIIGNTTLVLPYVYITIKARLVGMDPSIEEASLDLGANRFYTFMHVTLPAIVPGVMSGAFMAFSLALDDLIITSFLANAETATLPMKVYSMIKKGVSPEINALTTIIFGVSMVAMFAYLIKELVKMITIRRKKARSI